MNRAAGHAPDAVSWVAGIAGALALGLCLSVPMPAMAADNGNTPVAAAPAPTLPQAASSTAPTAKAATSTTGTTPALPASASSTSKAPAATSPLGSIEWAYGAFDVYGPTFKSGDGQNQLTLGLFVWYDNIVVTGENLHKPLGENNLEGSSRISTARLEFAGNYTEDFFYYFRADLQNNGSGNGHANVEWAALGIQHLPVIQNLLIGLQQPIYALDIWANYPRYRLMLEPSLINAFYRGPLLGITAYNVDMANHFSWGLGAARDTSDEYADGFQGISNGQDAFVVHGRFGWFPRYIEQGRDLLFFGVSGAYFKPKNHSITWGIWPETYTEDIKRWPLAVVNNLDWSMLGVAEFRAAEGPAWIQSDYVHNYNVRTGAPNLTFDGWYVEGGYFLTGEQTKFSPLALNGPVLPVPKFAPRMDRWGAVELQLRYSRLDMLDGDLQGGGPPFTQGASERNITFGINWFLNEHIKMGADYVHAMRPDLNNAHYDVIEARLAWNL